MKRYFFPLFFGMTIILFEDLVDEDLGIMTYFIKSVLFLAAILHLEMNLNDKNKDNGIVGQPDEGLDFKKKGLVLFSLIIGVVVGYLVVINF